MIYIVNFNGQIQVEAENEEEATKEAKTGILYSLDDMMCNKEDFLELKAIEVTI